VFLNIAKIYSLGHILVIQKRFFPKKIDAVRYNFMRNNFVTVQLNRTKLTGPLERIQYDLAKYNFKKCERGTGRGRQQGRKK